MTSTFQDEYAIIRHFNSNKKNQIIKTGLTLRAAQEHCSREDTHKVKANGDVVWFDGYTDMKNL